LRAVALAAQLLPSNASSAVPRVSTLLASADVGKVAALLGISADELRAKESARNTVADAANTPRRGPTAAEMDLLIGALTAKVSAQNFSAALFNATAGWLPFVTPWPRVDLRSVCPLNHARVVDDLLEVHGHEILIDGCFNGDPHPGNLLIVHSGLPVWAWRAAAPNALNAGSAEWQHDPVERAKARTAKVGSYATGDRLGLIDYGQVRAGVKACGVVT